MPIFGEIGCSQKIISLMFDHTLQDFILESGNKNRALVSKVKSCQRNVVKQIESAIIQHLKLGWFKNLSDLCEGRVYGKQ